jgi:hypothetical protein
VGKNGGISLVKKFQLLVIVLAGMDISHLQLNKDLIQNKYAKKKAPKKYSAKEFISCVLLF